eukprot:scaffold18.g1979.t1
MDPRDLDLDLLASIASGGLGKWDESQKSGKPVYVKSDDCVESLKDLQRFFRSDDPEDRPAFFAVSKYNFARSDLVPLIVTYPDDYDVVYNALKVCTFLTMPSSEPHLTQLRAKQEAHMQAVREAFLAQDALAAVVGMLAEPLSRHPRMTDQDAALVQLVIAFLRNLVAVPEAAPGDPAAEQAAARTKAGLLERLLGDHVMELLLLLAQHARQRPFKSEAPVLVEIFMLLFSGIEARDLLDAEKAIAAKQTAEAAQKRAKQQQQQQRGRGGRGPAAATTAHLPRLAAGAPALPKHLVQRAPARHAHSGAVFVRRHLDHGGTVVLRHNPGRSELPQASRIGASAVGVSSRQASSAAPAAAPGGRPRMRPALLVQMKAFLEHFLEGGSYDVVFKELEPGINISRLERSDFLSFIRLATFCTQYVRLREECKLEQGQKLEQQKQQNEKQGGATSSAGGAGAPHQQQGGQEQQPQRGEEGRQGSEAASPFSAISATLGWDAFSWLTMLWILLSNVEAKTAKQTNICHKDWTLQHASVPLLKEMLLTLDLARVAGTPADRRAADRLQRRHAAPRLAVSGLLHNDLKESGLLPVLSRLIRGYNYRFQARWGPRSHAVDLIETLHVVLSVLDRLSTAEPGGFRVKTKAAHQRGGRKKATPATKERLEREDGEGAAWASGLAGGEEQRQQHQQAGSEAGSDGNDGSGEQGDGAAASPKDQGQEELLARGGRTGDPLEEYEEEERQPVLKEVSFQAEKRIRQECAQPALVQFYVWLLREYKANAPFTNHAIVSFLRRIASPRQLDLEPMLWQLSVLRLFHAIMSDPTVRKDPQHADLLALATRTTRNMFARLVPDLSGAKAAAEATNVALGTRFEQARHMGERGNGDKQHTADLSGADGSHPQHGGQGEGSCEGEDGAQGSPQQQDPEAAEAERQRAAVELKVGPWQTQRSTSGVAGDGEEQLRDAFERCNGRKDCLAELVHEEERAKQLYEEHKGVGTAACDLVAQDLAAGFTGKQIKRRLRDMGVIAGRPLKGRARDRAKAAWDALMSDGDEEGTMHAAEPTQASTRWQDSALASMGGPRPASDDEGGASDASSDSSQGSDGGFVSAKESEHGSSGDDSDADSGGGKRRRGASPELLAGLPLGPVELGEQSEGEQEQQLAEGEPLARGGRKRSAAAAATVASDASGGEGEPEGSNGQRRGKKQRAAGAGKEERGRKRKVGGTKAATGARSEGVAKRKAEGEAEDASGAAQRRAALELLRRKRLGVQSLLQAEEEGEEEGGWGGPPPPSSLPPITESALDAAVLAGTEPFPGSEEQQPRDENAPPVPAAEFAPAAAPTAAGGGGARKRRFKKLGGPSGAARAAAPAGEEMFDLEDL